MQYVPHIIGSEKQKGQEEEYFCWVNSGDVVNCAKWLEQLFIKNKLDAWTVYKKDMDETLQNMSHALFRLTTVW
jgi:hypothetical protein